MVPNQCRQEHGPLLNSCGLALSQGTEAYLDISVEKVEKRCWPSVYQGQQHEWLVFVFLFCA